MEKIIETSIPVTTTKEITMVVPDYTPAVREAKDYLSYCKKAIGSAEKQIKMASTGIPEQMATWGYELLKPLWDVPTVLYKVYCNLSIDVNSVDRSQHNYRLYFASPWVDNQVKIEICHHGYGDGETLVSLVITRNGYTIDLKTDDDDEKANLLASLAQGWEKIKKTLADECKFYLDQYRNGHVDALKKRNQMANILENFQV